LALAEQRNAAQRIAGSQWLSWCSCHAILQWGVEANPGWKGQAEVQAHQLHILIFQLRVVLEDKFSCKSEVKRREGEK